MLLVARLHLVLVPLELSLAGTLDAFVCLLHLDRGILYVVVVFRPEVVLVLSRGLLLRHRLVVLESPAFFVSLLRLEVVMSVVVALVAVLAAHVVLARVLALVMPRLVPRRVVLEVLPALAALVAEVLAAAEFFAVLVFVMLPVMVPLR